ncbi:glycosyltransferase [Niallia sp. 03133]|uniref:glycosyltransferase n=1 Tax=Niallia sp. 03133 TaxID=3458060 RepID=UPI0040447C8E
MKILFVVNRFPNLSQTFVSKQIDGMISQGHEVSVLAGSSDGITGLSFIQKKIKEMIYYKNPKENILKITRFISLLPKCFLKRPITTLKALNVKKYGSLSFKLLFAIDALTKETGKYDILYAHFGPSGNFAAALKELGILDGKVATVFHGYDMSTYIDKAGQDIYQDLFAYGDLFLPISCYWKEKLVGMGCNENKIKVHYMGINVSDFQFNPIVPKGRIKLLSVARLTEKKGTIYAIKAVQRLIEKGYDIELNIIGDGPLKSQLEEIIGDEARIHLLGPKPNQEVKTYIEDCTIFLLPSVIACNGDMEGIPVALMEAMAIGKLVISTYHSGIPELIQDNENGWLVPERDSIALAEKIEEVLANKENWRTIQQNAREKIVTAHNLQPLNKQLENHFYSILEVN